MNNIQTTSLDIKCPFCKKQQSVMVPLDGLKKYLDGENVQDAFPMMHKDQREILISGICPECWDAIFTEK